MAKDLLKRYISFHASRTLVIAEGRLSVPPPSPQTVRRGGATRRGHQQDGGVTLQQPQLGVFSF